VNTPRAARVSLPADAEPRQEYKSRLGNPAFYDEFGVRYRVLQTSKDYVQRGIASWYGHPFHGRATSTGETYDMYAMTAAHKTLPLPTYVRVTDLDTGNRVVVRVNDRGPFVEGRVIDLSYVAAVKLGIADKGIARVEVRALDPPAVDPPGTGALESEAGDPPRMGAFDSRGSGLVPGLEAWLRQSEGGGGAMRVSAGRASSLYRVPHPSAQCCIFEKATFCCICRYATRCRGASER
jgi:rare lipoprotein A